MCMRHTSDNNRAEQATRRRARKEGRAPPDGGKRCACESVLSCTISRRQCCPFTGLDWTPSLYLSLCLCLSVSLSLGLSVYLSLCLAVWKCEELACGRVETRLDQMTCLACSWVGSRYVCLSICLSLFLSVCLCLSFSLSVCKGSVYIYF